MTQHALLPPELLGTYQRDGAVCLRDCFSEKWIGILNRGVDRNIANPGKYFSDFTSAKDASRAIKDDWCWEHIPEYQEFFYWSPAQNHLARCRHGWQVAVRRTISKAHILDSAHPGHSLACRHRTTRARFSGDPYERSSWDAGGVRRQTASGTSARNFSCKDEYPGTSKSLCARASCTGSLSALTTATTGSHSR